MKPSVLFFGSFLHYSTLVAQALHQSPQINLVGVVTTPPVQVATRRRGQSASGNKHLNKTHTHQWAEKNSVPIFYPKTLSGDALTKIAEELKSPPQFILSAGYGKLVPSKWLSFPTIAPLNLHFSLLPQHRGANPAEWAILSSDTETGVTLITMDDEFDTGKIITRATTSIDHQDTRESLYDKLYTQAAHLAVTTLPHLANVDFATPQDESEASQAPRFLRAHGYIAWPAIAAAMKGETIDPTPHLSTHLRMAWQVSRTKIKRVAVGGGPPKTLSNGVMRSLGEETDRTREISYQLPHFIETATRALFGFPGLWTYLPTKQGKKRLKLLSASIQAVTTNPPSKNHPPSATHQLVLDQVQLEGKSPSTFNQIKNQIV